MPAVPITVRQLEAVVRISESLARMQLQISVQQAHVAQALDLFKASTMDAVRSGATDTMVRDAVTDCPAALAGACPSSSCEISARMGQASHAIAWPPWRLTVDRGAMSGAHRVLTCNQKRGGGANLLCSGLLFCADKELL